MEFIARTKEICGVLHTILSYKNVLSSKLLNFTHQDSGIIEKTLGFLAFEKLPTISKLVIFSNSDSGFHEQKNNKLSNIFDKLGVPSPALKNQGDS